MKNYLIILICSISIYTSFLNSQTKPVNQDTNYFPLHVGNTWQYIKHTTDGGGVERYSLHYSSVDEDTISNNQKYFYYVADWLYDSDWIFYSDSTLKLFVFWQDTNRIFMDFTLSIGSNFQQFVIGRHTYSEAQIIGNFYGLGYYRYQPIAARHFEEIYSNNLGPVKYKEWSYQMFNIFIEYDLIQAILLTEFGDTTLYTNQFKPIFSITPRLLITSPNFSFNFNVNHEYSYFLPPGFPGNGLNFIDSVWTYRYYSNGDSIINLSTILAYNNPAYANSEYSVNFPIDTSLMKNGYNLYYKFLAKDKGIIPEYAFSPDSGYYECKWDFTNSISDHEDIVSYSLKQNYPNPFNPVTTINYTLAESGIVELVVFNILGQEVKILVNEYKIKGEYRVNFDASELTSGVYFYRIKSGDYIQTMKMLLLK